MARKPRPSAPREVFLSHASPDRRIADRIAGTLGLHGVPVWYSATHLMGAQQWHDEIGEARVRCDWFIVLLSPAATRSIWVKYELLYALSDRKFQNRIIPILCRRCDQTKLSWALPAIQNVRFTENVEAGFRALLRIWGLGYKAT